MALNGTAAVAAAAAMKGGTFDISIVDKKDRPITNRKIDVRVGSDKVMLKSDAEGKLAIPDRFQGKSAKISCHLLFSNTIVKVESGTRVTLPNCGAKK